MDGNRPVQYGLRASNEFGIAVKCVQRGLNVCSCICARVFTLGECSGPFSLRSQGEMGSERAGYRV